MRATRYPPAHPTNADLARAAWCARNGHTWPPLSQAKPGDEHDCEFCAANRFIGPDGRPSYRQYWELSCPARHPRTAPAPSGIRALPEPWPAPGDPGTAPALPWWNATR